MRTPREVDLSPWQRAFMEAARDLDAFHAGPNPVNVRGAFTRWHAGFAYLDDARHRPNLTILDRAVADRVLRAGAAVTHARVIREGAALDLEARAVVLACGAYGSPLVLQRSGIGPAEELDRLGVPVVADLPVGDGLVDHPGAGMAWKPTRRLEHDMEAYGHEPGRLHGPGDGDGPVLLLRARLLGRVPLPRGRARRGAEDVGRQRAPRSR